MTRYHAYLEGEPTLDAYRLSHEPRTDYGLVFVCPFAVVTGESGSMYQLMRGIQGGTKGEVINYGIYRLDGELDQQAPHLYPYAEVPVVEPYWVSEDRSAVSYVGKSFRFDFGIDTYTWEDATGRVDLHAERIGQVCSFWVPEQTGFDMPQLLRSHAAKVTGTIGDDPVEGLFMLDQIYSRPEAHWSEMGMLDKLHNLWLNFLVEYEDGSYEAGFAWRGRPGTDFAAVHHIVDGVSTARTDAKIVTHLTGRGSVATVDLQFGDDVRFRLDQYGSCDWPLHTCGTVGSTGRDKKIARSWNYTEHFPLNWPDLHGYMAAHTRLYGKAPSFRTLMEGARVEDELLVWD